jgi:hypothetical protein
MSKELDGHVLYREDSNVPVICERPDWKKCPEHKHLNDTPSGDSGFDEGLVEASSADLVDDPNDNIVSVNEYSTGAEDRGKVVTQIDLMAGDAESRKAHSERKLTAAEELVASTQSLEGREGEPFKKLLNRNLYEMRVMGIGENFGVDYMRTSIFGNYLGKCDQCGKRVRVSPSGRWVHGGNKRRCPSVTSPIDFAS